MGRLTGVLVGLLAFAPSASAVAQGLPVLPSDRVRVVAGRTWTGEVQAISADSLVLRRDPVGNRLSLPLSSIQRLEVSDGRRPRGKYAGVGAAIGGGVGLVLGLMTKSGDCGVDRDSDPFGLGGGICDSVGTVSLILLPVVGMLAGAGAGAIAGGGERWRRVFPAPAVSLDPQGGGRFDVAVRLRASRHGF